MDAKNFTGVPSSIQPELSKRVVAVLAEAFRRVGLADAWKAATLHQDTGDGHVVVLATDCLPRLVHPLIDEVQAVLEDEDRDLRAVRRDLRLRLRLSLHMGPLPTTGSGLREDGKGKTMNELHRLLDSAPVRTALVDSDPEVTLIAAVLSQRVFVDVVRQRYTGMEPTRFHRVEATVQGKSFKEEAWLYVPKPSWLSGGPGRGEEPDMAPAPEETTMSENRGNIALNNVIGQDLNQHRHGRS